MMRKILLGAVMVVIAAVLSTGVHGQEDRVVVDNSVFEVQRRLPARFVHDDHNEKAGLDDCARCHHVYDENGRLDETDSSEGQPCSECHAAVDQESQPGLRKAFHRMCRGCHLAEGNGPVVCAQCHAQPAGS